MIELKPQTRPHMHRLRIEEIAVGDRVLDCGGPIPVLVSRRTEATVWVREEGCEERVGARRSGRVVTELARWTPEWDAYFSRRMRLRRARHAAMTAAQGLNMWGAVAELPDAALEAIEALMRALEIKP